MASARAHKERTDQRSNPVESKARSLLTGAETPKGPNLPRRGEFFFNYFNLIEHFAFFLLFVFCFRVFV